MGEISKILIANRGEIALRIMKTCNKLNIKSVAIFSKADQNDISVFDTSSIYGNSELRLGDNYSYKRKIVTKVGELNGDSLKTSLLRSLKRLKSSNIYGYLFHRPEILLNNNYLWENMKTLKVDFP